MGSGGEGGGGERGVEGRGKGSTTPDYELTGSFVSVKTPNSDPRHPAVYRRFFGDVRTQINALFPSHEFCASTFAVPEFWSVGVRGGVH